MRCTGPAAHMTAFTSSIRLSARRNLLSANSSSRRHASMQAAVCRDAAASRGRCSADSPESIEIRLHAGFPHERRLYSIIFEGCHRNKRNSARSRKPSRCKLPA